MIQQTCQLLFILNCGSSIHESHEKDKSNKKRKKNSTSSNGTRRTRRMIMLKRNIYKNLYITLKDASRTHFKTQRKALLFKRYKKVQKHRQKYNKMQHFTSNVLLFFVMTLFSFCLVFSISTQTRKKEAHYHVYSTAKGNDSSICVCIISINI